MIKKTTLISFLFTAFTTLSAQSQLEDVTNLYITNPGFDIAGSFADADVNGSYDAHEVQGWQHTTATQWVRSAAFSIASGYQLNNQAVPTTNSNGNTTGGVLGLSAAWSNTISYYQDVTLPAGHYRLTFNLFNPIINKGLANQIGFEESNGTKHFGTAAYYPQAWTEDYVEFMLLEETSGKINIGCQAANYGSGDLAIWFIDNVKLEVYNPAETHTLGEEVAFTQIAGSGTADMYPDITPAINEYYEGSKYVGKGLSSTTSGLVNGTYMAEVYAHAHIANIAVGADVSGNRSSVLRANGVETPIEIVINNGKDVYEPSLRKLYNIPVTDGNLNISVSAKVNGANWHTAHIKSIRKMNTPSIDFGAFKRGLVTPFPAQRDFWYRVDIPFGGIYTVTSSSAATLRYTQDGSLPINSENLVTYDLAAGATTHGIDLSVGTFYISASAASTLEIIPASYQYRLGDATVNVEYSQYHHDSGRRIYVTFTDMTSNNPLAVLSRGEGKVAVDNFRESEGNLPITMTSNGFWFYCPHKPEGTTCHINIDADAFRFGQDGNGYGSCEAISLTFKTTTVYDGTFYMAAEIDGKRYYLARGGSYATQAVLDEIGLPVSIVTDEHNVTQITFLDNRMKLFGINDNACYTDYSAAAGRSTDWTFQRGEGLTLSNSLMSDKFIRYESNAGVNRLFINGDEGSANIVKWILETPDQYNAMLAAKKEANQEMKDEITGWAQTAIVEAQSVTASKEQFQGGGDGARAIDIMRKSIDLMPGIYKFTIQAFHRMASYVNVVDLHNNHLDNPPVCIFFGDTKLPVMSVLDEPSVNITGGHAALEGVYPNTLGQANTAFAAGLYKNELWVRITKQGTYDYGIINQGYPGANSQWTSYNDESIEIVRYYDSTKGDHYVGEGESRQEGKYLQPGDEVSVIYPYAFSKDETLSFDLTGITLDGNVVAGIVADQYGFHFTLPVVPTGIDHTLSIPTGALKYGTKAQNTAQNITIKTAAVYDGLYFMKTTIDEETLYLGRSNEYGTHASLDYWGLPVRITTTQDNLSRIQFADNGMYMFGTGDEAYTDFTVKNDNNRDWKFTKVGDACQLSNALQPTKVTVYGQASSAGGNFDLLMNSWKNIRINGNSSDANAIAWQFEDPATHQASVIAARNDAQTLSSTVAGLNKKIYKAFGPKRVAEKFQGKHDVVFNGQASTFNVSAPGIYHLKVLAFARATNNDNTYALHEQDADCHGVYLQFGDQKILLKSVFDEAVTAETGFSIDGNNYPNGTAGALAAFKEGRYSNDIWVEITELGDYTCQIVNQGKIGDNLANWICWASDGIQITRYYTDEQGPDADDVAAREIYYKKGDINYDFVIDETDAPLLKDMVMGRTPAVKRAHLVSDENSESVDIRDLTEWYNLKQNVEQQGATAEEVVDQLALNAQVEAKVFTEQSASENTTDATASYAIKSAVSTTLTSLVEIDSHINMTNYMTCLNITINKAVLPDIKSISIYSKDKAKIAGEYTITTAAGAASYNYEEGTGANVYAANAQSDVVNIDIDNNELTTYKAYLLPVALPNGITMTIRRADSSYVSKDFATITPGAVNNLAIDNLDGTTANLWMSTIPGSTYFSMLSMPGAHNSCTSNVSNRDAARCQSKTLEELMSSGVRAFDLRPRYTSNNASDIQLTNLEIYHGQVATGVKFKDAIDALINFVKQNPSETVFVLMQKENSSGLFASKDQSEIWRQSIRECVTNNDRKSYLLDKITGNETLDDVRGKVVLVSKNPYGNASNSYWDVVYGGILTDWPDNTSTTNAEIYYAWGAKGPKVSALDDYKTQNTTSKKGNIAAMLTEANGDNNRNRLYFTFTNIAWAVGSITSINAFATTINPTTTKTITGLGEGRLGFVYADYIGRSNSDEQGGNSLLNAIIQQNYKYVYKGNSRK